MDVVGLAQEPLHIVKNKREEVVILKLDLQKSYDFVKWDFLCFFMLQIGLSLHMVNWILECVTTSSFAILINGSPTSFFKGCRDFTRGVLCLLYYLF